MFSEHSENQIELLEFTRLEMKCLSEELKIKLRQSHKAKPKNRQMEIRFKRVRIFEDLSRRSNNSQIMEKKEENGGKRDSKK